MSYLNAGADWRKRNYLIEPDVVSGCANTGAVNRVTAAQFSAAPGIITFNEVALGTEVPLITSAMYGGGGSTPDVQFCQYLTGQSRKTLFDPPPGPLHFLKGAITVTVTADTSAIPERPATVNDPAWLAVDPLDPRVLGVDNNFTLKLPMAMVFSFPVVGVGFTLGGFNKAPGGAYIKAYDVDANLLGEWVNEGPLPGAEFESFYLNRDSNVGIIKAITIELDILESQSIAMKNVVFTTSCV